MAGGWVKVNSEQRGYYRVNYDGDGWQALTAALLRDHEVGGEPAARLSCDVVS